MSLEDQPSPRPAHPGDLVIWVNPFRQRFPNLSALSELVASEFESDATENKRGSKRYYLPAPMVHQVVTRESVTSVLQETTIDIEKHQGVTDWILKSASRLFLTLVQLSADAKEIDSLSCLEQLRAIQLDDGCLPLPLYEPLPLPLSNIYSLPINLEAFRTAQLPFTTPVFGDTGPWVTLRLHREQALPFSCDFESSTQVDDYPECSSFFRCLNSPTQLFYFPPLPRTRHWLCASIPYSQLNERDLGGLKLITSLTELDSISGTIAVAILTRRESDCYTCRGSSVCRRFLMIDDEMRKIEQLQRISSRHLVLPIAGYQKGFYTPIGYRPSSYSLMFSRAGGVDLYHYFGFRDHDRLTPDGLRWVIEQLSGVASVFHNLLGFDDLAPDCILWFVDDHGGRGMLKVLPDCYTAFQPGCNAFRRILNRRTKKQSDRVRRWQWINRRLTSYAIRLVIWLVYGYDGFQLFNMFKEELGGIWTPGNGSLHLKRDVVDLLFAIRIRLRSNAFHDYLLEQVIRCSLAVHKAEQASDTPTQGIQTALEGILKLCAADDRLLVPFQIDESLSDLWKMVHRSSSGLGSNPAIEMNEEKIGEERKRETETEIGGRDRMKQKSHSRC